MAKKGTLNRRSFMTRVAGASLTAGAAALVTGCASQGPAYTGYTDSDYGSYADRAGYGRGARRSCTDSDTQATNNRTDPIGYGRRC